MSTAYNGLDHEAECARELRKRLVRSNVDCGSPDEKIATACAVILIPNFAHLAEAYGLAFALGVSGEIKRRISAKFLTNASADLVCLGNDGFLLRANEVFSDDAHPRAGRPSVQIEALLTEVGREAVNLDGMVALAHLHADWLPLSGLDMLTRSEIELLAWAWSAQPLPATLRGEVDDAWRERYRTDMEVAVRVNDALAVGCVEVAWRPVIDAHEAAQTLYREAIARISPDGHAPAMGSDLFMSNLERLGLTRLFDRRVMERVINDLRLHPDASMAVNISARSARLDHWWASVLSALESERALARRLIVEITGGIGLSDLEASREFCAQFQQLGCRIAIDGLGASTADLESVRSCCPDIVKLEASFVRQARQSDVGRAGLRGRLKLCMQLAPIVVVDGIEVEDDLHNTLRAGARWMQGYYLGGPNAQPRVPAVAWQPLAPASAAPPANERSFILAAVARTSVVALLIAVSGGALPSIDVASPGLAGWLQQLIIG